MAVLWVFCSCLAGGCVSVSLFNVGSHALSGPFWDQGACRLALLAFSFAAQRFSGRSRFLIHLSASRDYAWALPSLLLLLFGWRLAAYYHQIPQVRGAKRGYCASI